MIMDEDQEVETADVIVTYGSDIDTALLNRAKSLKMAYGCIRGC